VYDAKADILAGIPQDVVVPANKESPKGPLTTGVTADVAGRLALGLPVTPTDLLLEKEAGNARAALLNPGTDLVVPDRPLIVPPQAARPPRSS
jgi:hypothetical protein